MQYTTQASTRRTRRGACMECKQKKKRCDGGQPCTHCQNAPFGPLECEYPAVGQPTESQILEEAIARLEDRIQELENPQEYLESTIFLRQPYESDSEPPSPPIIESAADLQRERLEKDMIKVFFEKFKHFGLFLNQSQLRDSIGSLIPSLRNVILLWGSRLLPDLSLSTADNALLCKTLQSLGEDLSGSHPQRSIQAIQVEILLALWYLNSNSLVQARYHAHGAVSLAVANGLQMNQEPLKHNSVSLPVPVDVTEAQERVDAFWTALLVANCLTLDSPYTPFNYQSDMIGTPWTLKSDLAPNFQKTILDFLDGSNHSPPPNDLAALVQASILHERVLANVSTNIIGGNTLSEEASMVFENRLNILKDRVSSPSPSPAEVLTMVLLETALVRLYASNISGENSSNAQHMTAAVHRVAITLQSIDTENICSALPIISLLAGVMGDTVYITQRVHLHSVSDPAIRTDLTNAVHEISTFLSTVTTASPICAYYVSQMRDQLRTL